MHENKEKYFKELYMATWKTVYFLSLKKLNHENDAEDV